MYQNYPYKLLKSRREKEALRKPKVRSISWSVIRKDEKIFFYFYLDFTNHDVRTYADNWIYRTHYKTSDPDFTLSKDIEDLLLYYVNNHKELNERDKKDYPCRIRYLLINFFNTNNIISRRTK